MKVTPNTLADAIDAMAAPIAHLGALDDTLVVDSLRVAAARRGYQLVRDPLMVAAIEIGVSTEFLIEYDGEVLR